MIAPILAGVLFTAGYSLPTTAMVLAVGSLLGAGMLLLLKLDGDRVVEVPTAVAALGGQPRLRTGRRSRL